MVKNPPFDGSVARVVIATVFAYLAYRLVGALVAVVTLNGILRVYEDANEFLDVFATATNLVAALLTLVALRWAVASRRARLLRENAELLSTATVVMVVVATYLTVDFLFLRLDWLFHVPIANATQVDFGGVAWRVLVLGVTPSLLGMFLILRFGAKRAAARDSAG